MKLNVYSIRDPDGGYLTPFVCPDDRRAISSVLYSVLREEPGAVKPHDLMRIGRFNSETGRLSGLPPVKGVGQDPVLVYSFTEKDFTMIRKEFGRVKESDLPASVR